MDALQGFTTSKSALFNRGNIIGDINALKGFATLTFGDSFKITNVAIMQNQDTGELFVSMPRYKTNEKDENNE